MNVGKASLHVVLAAVLGLVFIGGIAYLSALITKNTLPEEESGGGRSGYKIFSSENGNRMPGQEDVKVEYAKEEWATYGGDYYNRRYSELDQVDLGTIHDLKPAWVTSLGMGIGEDALGEAAPIVADGVMYIAASSGVVMALDAGTGEKIWDYQPKTMNRQEGDCCRKTIRSVAIGEGRVYVGNPDTTLVALDQKTGKVIWKKEVADWEQGYRMTSAPLYYNGKIYTGVSGGRDDSGGYVIALDAENGRDVWKFHDIPVTTEQQADVKTAQEEALKSGGMTAVWNTPAVDPELGAIYFAAGYSMRNYDEQGQDNLVANLIVAVDAESGEYVWHFRDDSSDIGQAQSITPVVLFDVQYEGEMKKALGQAGKKGWMYLLDRKDGSPLLTPEEGTAFQVKDPEPGDVRPFAESEGTALSTDGNKIAEKTVDIAFKGRASSVFNSFWEPQMKEPADRAEETWQPSAYSPKTEYYYVMAGNEEVGTAGTEKARKIHGGNVGEGTEASSPNGHLTAVDINTKQIAWQVDWKPAGYAGILATAGDVVFAGGHDGQVSALHAATGQEVWSYRTGADINTPAVTYKIGEEQYMAVVTVEKALAGAVYSQKIYTFKLGGAWDGIANDASGKKKEE
ncbi:MAG: pyrroloquinoline quinone-dependent dehydrogenase [Lysinibacillus sp.]